MGEPLSDLLKMKNAACDINLYEGGMACCRGGVFLLDKDQDVPPLVDEIYYKWRFYYEVYDPAAHLQTYHLEWQVRVVLCCVVVFRFRCCSHIPALALV